MEQFAVADAHVHFWDLEQHFYPWLAPAEPTGPFGKTGKIRHTYLLDDYLGDAGQQNVDRLIHVEAGWNRSDPLGEMNWIQKMFQMRGAPHAHIAHIDLSEDDAERLVTKHAEFPLFRGVRDRLLDGDFTKPGSSPTRMTDSAWLRGMAILDRYGLAFDLQAPPAISIKAAKLARSYDGVRFVLTHAAYPPAPTDQAAYGQWVEGIAHLAAEPNVSIKLSGLMLGEKSWNPLHAKAVVEVILRAFGTERVMISSNFPVDKLFAPLDQLFGAYRSWIAHLSEQEQRNILRHNACRIYGVL